MADRIGPLLARVAGYSGDARLTHGRARFGFERSKPPAAGEREALRRTLGAELRAVRGSTGMSAWTLACRSGCARSTVERLEGGQRRPTPSMLASLALAHRWTVPALPWDRAGVESAFLRLLDAAGASLVADTPGGVRRRERRLHEAWRVWQRQCRQAFEAKRTAEAVARAELDAAMCALTPSRLDDPAVLGRALRALNRSVHRDGCHEGGLLDASY